MSHHNAKQLVWTPWHELNNFVDPIARLFGMAEQNPSTDYPPVNVWKGDNLIQLAIKLPGIKANDIEVNINHEILTIKGECKAEELPEGTALLRNERLAGSFTRSFSLPFAVDNDAVEASYKDGILKIRLPKAKAEQPRKICIRNNEQ